MSATWWPFSMARMAASKATMVFPEPTSPCSSRFMGTGCSMSSAISLSTRFCAAVGWKGRIFLMASRAASLTGKEMPGVCRALLGGRRHPELEEEKLFVDEPLLRGGAEGFERVERRVFLGEVRQGERRAPVREAVLPEERGRQRVGERSRQAPQGLEDKPAEHPRGDGAGGFVDGHEAAGLGRVNRLARIGLAPAGENLVLRLEHLQLPRPVGVLFHLAVKHDALARTEDAHQVVAVEPLGVEDAALVAHGRMEGAAAAAPVAHKAGGQDLGLDAGNDAGPELSDGGGG